jgi:hypothetical protein
MAGYGMMRGSRLEQAQAQCRRRQQALKQLARAESRRILMRELRRLESWTLEKALKQAKRELR